MASTPMSWPSDGIINLSHIISPRTASLEQLDDVEYMVPIPQPSLRKRQIMRQRAPLACIACRSQHAKCSGESPKCNRCQVEQRDCQYPKSRRKRASMTVSSPTLINVSDNGIFASQLDQETVRNPSDTANISLDWPDWSESITGEATTPSTELSPNAPEYSCFSTPVSQFVDTYYDYFHRSHPIAPSRSYVNTLIQSNNLTAISMLYAIQYVGAVYLKAATAENLKSLALQYIDHDAFDTAHQSIYQVGATLMLTIAVYGQGEPTEAREMLEKAILRAMSIDMIHNDSLIHRADKELVELWKRICWYLYITSAQLRNVEDDRDTLSFFPTLDFPLPCKEVENLSSAAVQTMESKCNLHDYDASDFDENPNEFSSFTYLVALVRISQSIKEIHKLPPEQLERAATCADARLMNWKARLPLEKRKAIDANGEVDDIMFQAHILSYSLCIDVHTLLSSPERQATSMFHAKKALEAAEDALGLLTLYTCPLRISPLSISHISKCTLACLPTARFKPRPNIRDYVSFILNSLQQLSAVWAATSPVTQTIRHRARRAYTTQSMPDLSTTTSEFPADITRIHPLWT